VDLQAYLVARQALIDEALDRALPPASEEPTTIHQAMRYSLFAGGKRLRPILCVAAAEAVGGQIEEAMGPACAVECIHTYSLIHDDLPCMDDDDLRRGRPTCHKVYGEGMAVLAGDALLTAAFEILAGCAGSPRFSAGVLVKELSIAAGSRWLIAGQVLDLENERRVIEVDDVRRVHEAKTAALLVASLRLGAMTADASEEELAALTRFGRALGLAFQIIDDILDVTQSSEVLGKSAGKDVAAGKATYPATLGLEGSREEARRLTDEALAALGIFGERGEMLRQIGTWLLARKY
jgi:geranylgeranyl diphosphate synthase type II